MAKPTNVNRIVNLRPGMVFGEGDRGNLIKLIKTIGKKRYVQIGTGKTLKSLIYSRDLARGVIDCINNLPEGRHILNAANPEAVSMAKLSNEIWQVLGVREKFRGCRSNCFWPQLSLLIKSCLGSYL